MRKGSKRCHANGCFQEAIGALLISGPFSSDPMFPTHGVYGCAEHLYDAMRRELARKLTLQELLIARAKSADAKYQRITSRRP